MPTLSFYLPERSDLLQRLREEENASTIIRQALEMWYQEPEEEDKLEDIIGRLKRMEEMMSKGTITDNDSTSTGDDIDASAIDEAMAQW